MNPRKYFPLGKAYGEAFCNREKETKWLVDNILSGKHSLLIAPRRYGKSSLAEKAIAQAELPAVPINFHLCTSEEEVAQLILNSVIRLIGKSAGQVEKIITSIKKYVANLNPKISFGDAAATLELIPKEHTNYSLIIVESLLLVEKLLREKNKKAVIFFDEFQEISRIAKHANIEGAIRTAAQEMQNVALIFSGSMRSMLLQMFDDESRPLYKLCRKLQLERITEEHYRKHINKIATATWQKSLDDETFKTIIESSKQHPYYINYLCDVVWEDNKKLPKVTNISMAWDIVIREEWSDAIKEISILSLAQRKILRFIATEKTVNLTSHESSALLKMAPSTITSAVNVLIEKDYLEMTDKGYQIINPIVLEAMKREYPEIQLEG